MQRSICHARFRGKFLREGAPRPSLPSYCHSLSPLARSMRRARRNWRTIEYCSPVVFNDIKHLTATWDRRARFRHPVTAGGLSHARLPWALPRERATSISAIISMMAVESQRAGPPHPAFPAFLAGAGRPLLPSMIDYSVFSQLAAAHASIISGPVSRSAHCFHFCI